MSTTRATLAILSILALTGAAWATTDCTFTTTGTTMKLDADCWTDETIYVPDGITLDGKRHSITAYDPTGGHFVGAVVANGGAWATVKNLTIVGMFMANVCDGGADRLRGIMFDGASGEISKNTVMGINQGASGCQEGNGIEVRNAPFDGTHPNTQMVKVKDNLVVDYQKTGIVANGDLMVTIEKNRLSESATQLNLAANTIQVAYGAMGTVSKNKLDGNQWFGWSPASDYASTAMLFYFADMLKAEKNKVTGNSDIGLYIYADNGLYKKNDLKDEGVDSGGYDIGIGNWGTGNTLDKNKVKGFDIPYDPPVESLKITREGLDVAVPHPFR